MSRDSLAARTRAAVRRTPSLRAALAAGVLNYTAAARHLDVGDRSRGGAGGRGSRSAGDPPAGDGADGGHGDGGDEDHVEAVATALRRCADDLELTAEDRAVRVRMRTGVAVGGARGTDGTVETDDPGAGDGTAGGDSDGSDDGDGTVGGLPVVDGGDSTAVVARGDVDATALSAALGRLDAADVGVEAAGVAGDALAVVVARRDGADALRTVEATLDAVPVVVEDGNGEGE